MQINFHQKAIHLSDNQKDYISAKIEQLSKYKIMEDPSVLVRVDVEFQQHLSSDKKILMAVTVNIPQDVLRAETDCIAVEEGIDLIEEKLRHQLEKHKTAHA
jgi:ribosomal subunit interface protein